MNHKLRAENPFVFGNAASRVSAIALSSSTGKVSSQDLKQTWYISASDIFYCKSFGRLLQLGQNAVLLFHPLFSPAARTIVADIKQGIPAASFHWQSLGIPLFQAFFCTFTSAHLTAAHRLPLHAPAKILSDNLQTAGQKYEDLPNK